MKRLLLIAAAAIFVFSFVYGGKDYAGNTDRTNKDIHKATNNIKLQNVSTKASAVKEDF